MDYIAILNEAQLRRKAISAELENLDRFIAVTADLAGLCGDTIPLVQSPLGLAPRTMMPSPPSYGDGRGTEKAVREAPVMNATIDAASHALRSIGTVTSTRALLPHVLERGVEVGGKDAIGTLSARLSNSKAFTNHKGEGWWFKDEPVPTRNAQSSSEEAEGQSLAGKPSASITSQERTENAPSVAKHE